MTYTVVLVGKENVYLPSTCLRFLHPIKNAFIERHLVIDTRYSFLLLDTFLLLAGQQVGGQYFDALVMSAMSSSIDLPDTR
jgi:hypothetical protein